MNSATRLSKLQKQILALALKNQIEEGRGLDAKTGADLYNSQVLADVYRFPPRSQLRYEEHYEHVAGDRRPYLHFDTDEIGRARYSKALAAISRAMARLEKRGLITRLRGRITNWGGCNLTAAGVEMAKTVNIPVNLPES